MKILVSSAVIFIIVWPPNQLLATDGILKTDKGWEISAVSAWNSNSLTARKDAREQQLQYAISLCRNEYELSDAESYLAGPILASSLKREKEMLETRSRAYGELYQSRIVASLSEEDLACVRNELKARAQVRKLRFAWASGAFPFVLLAFLSVFVWSDRYTNGDRRLALVSLSFFVLAGLVFAALLSL